MLINRLFSRFVILSNQLEHVYLIVSTIPLKIGRNIFWLFGWILMKLEWTESNIDENKIPTRSKPYGTRTTTTHYQPTTTPVPPPTPPAVSGIWTY